MMHLRWDRLSFMVVDDNRFVRRLLEGMLKAIGVKTIVSIADCANAIRLLKLSKVDPIKAGLGTVDMILCDYLMPSVDGSLFLRWIRTGNQVPDRFVPFIMVSGAADREIVEQARDAGMTEFIAKPFSAKSVANRLLQVINRPRPFVLAPGYFGPDRRRAKSPVEQERRTTNSKQIQTLTKESNEKVLREDVRAIHFHTANKLKDKLGANALKDEVDIDPLVIQAAEARIQDLLGDYSDWVRRYIRSMVRSLNALEIAEYIRENQSETENRKHIAKINRIAHELRGQGGIFDYPLITALGKSLYQTTTNPAMTITANRQDLLRAHVDTIRTVFKNKIRGDGGEVGAALLQEISDAVEREKQ